MLKHINFLIPLAIIADLIVMALVIAIFVKVWS